MKRCEQIRLGRKKDGKRAWEDREGTKRGREGEQVTFMIVLVVHVVILIYPTQTNMWLNLSFLAFVYSVLLTILLPNIPAKQEMLCLCMDIKYLKISAIPKPLF